jgi:TolA-binding protein
MLSDTAGALEADARLRLGRSLLAVGREGDAHAEWSLVVRRFPGTTAAAAAARLLVQPGG